MIIVINPNNRESYGDLLDETFKLRHAVFNNRLGWNLPSLFGREIDQYDTEKTYYLISYNKERGVYGGCRLLPTTGPYMLEGTFPQLDCGNHPKTKDVWECTRFFIHQESFTSAEIGPVRLATYELMLGLLEYGFYKNLKRFITPSEIRIERIFNMMGCPLERISDPVPIGNAIAVAANVNVYEDYLLNLQRKSGIRGSVLFEC